MGKWILTNEYIAGVLVLTYMNLVERLDAEGRVWEVGATWECGEMRADTSYVMILQWIINQTMAVAGDVVIFPDGTVFQVSVHAAAA
jgi:hypothetical protein